METRVFIHVHTLAFLGPFSDLSSILFDYQISDFAYMTLSQFEQYADDFENILANKHMETHYT